MIDAMTVNQRRTRRFCFAVDFDWPGVVETEVDTGVRLGDVRAETGDSYRVYCKP